MTQVLIGEDVIKSLTAATPTGTTTEMMTRLVGIWKVFGEELVLLYHRVNGIMSNIHKKENTSTNHATFFNYMDLFISRNLQYGQYCRSDHDWALNQERGATKATDTKEEGGVTTTTDTKEEGGVTTTTDSEEEGWGTTTTDYDEESASTTPTDLEEEGDGWLTIEKEEFVFQRIRIRNKDDVAGTPEIPDPENKGACEVTVEISKESLNRTDGLKLGGRMWFLIATHCWNGKQHLLLSLECKRGRRGLCFLLKYNPVKETVDSNKEKPKGSKKQKTKQLEEDTSATPNEKTSKKPASAQKPTKGGVAIQKPNSTEKAEVEIKFTVLPEYFANPPNTIYHPPTLAYSVTKPDWVQNDATCHLLCLN
eukprot:GHVS01032987.1.p1 GENE.GHVS01032987.1~~GHVS01032987.1.p1  ORF type:complete len:366 (-),score=43.85 GHVS01032987.1:99-1196(-)